MTDVEDVITQFGHDVKLASKLGAIPEGLLQNDVTDAKSIIYAVYG